LLLKDEVAVVTGSSRGIGAATAIKLAEEGADLVINYNSDRESAEETAAEVRELGRKALIVQGNVANSDDAKNLIKSTIDEYGKIDILVNNAGITKDGLILRMKEKDFSNVIDVNLKGTFNCTKNAIRYMMKQRHGKIVNLSSVVGLMGNAGQANYAASKAGVVGFSKSVAKEVSKRGINVNVVAPGYIDTEMTEELPSKVKEDMLDNIPLNRFGEVEDVANVILFLVSPLSSYVNGQTINIDGGMLMWKEVKMMAEVLDRIVKVVSEELAISEDEITEDASFIDDLGADSLDVVELIMALEEEFDIEIPDEDAEEIGTVSDAVDYIEENL